MQYTITLHNILLNVDKESNSTDSEEVKLNNLNFLWVNVVPFSCRYLDQNLYRGKELWKYDLYKLS